MKNKIRIGAMISGGGTNLQAIIDACESGRINGEMIFVGSDNPKAAGLGRAQRHGIPSFVVDYGAIIQKYKEAPERLKIPSDFDIDEIIKKQNLFKPDGQKKTVERYLTTRAVAEARLLEKMAAYPVDLLVLAGFMRNLTPYFIDRFNTDPDHPRCRPFPAWTVMATLIAMDARPAAARFISSITARIPVRSSASAVSPSPKRTRSTRSNERGWNWSGSSTPSASNYLPKTVCRRSY
jgi:folate-dependent phosphoribosylglycinamide formyltransferase PurN